MSEISMNTSSDLSSESGSGLSNDTTSSSIQSDPNLHLMQQACFLYLKITEEPQEKFRYRYGTDNGKGSHGSLTGINHKKNNKTYPTVKLENYKDRGRVYIIAKVFTTDQQPIQHVHELKGQSCEGGETKVFLDKDMSAKFKNISIQFTKKAHCYKILTKKMEKEKNSELSVEEKVEVENQIKQMNMHSVRLGFQAFVNGQREPLCDMIFSQPIRNESDLKILRISKVSGSRAGDEEVFLLCNKMKKESIKVRFFEPDDPDGWKGFGTFSVADVHHQLAIVFRTPPYAGRNQEERVDVCMELYDTKTNATSESRKFTYYTNETDTTFISDNRKRKRENEEQVAITSSNSDQQQLYLNMNKSNNLYNNSFSQNCNNDDQPMEVNLQGNMLSGNNANMDECFQSLDENSSSLNKQLKTDIGIPDEMLSPNYQFSEHFSENQLFSLPELSENVHNDSEDALNADVCRNQSLFIYHTSKDQSSDEEIVEDVHFEEPIWEAVEFNALRRQWHIWNSASAKRSARSAFEKISEFFYVLRSLVYNSALCLKKILCTFISLSCYYVLDWIKWKFTGSRETHTSNLKGREKCELNGRISHMIHLFRDLVTTCNEDGNSLLHILASNKGDNSYFIERLIDLTPAEKINIVNQTNHSFQTPIHLAIILEKPSILRKLLKKIEKNYIKNYWGNTLLHIAAENNSIKCLEVIIRCKRPLAIGNLDVLNNEGLTPLHIAVKKKYISIAEMLVDLGADVNIAETQSGKTALHLAVNCNSYDMVEFLLNQPQINIEMEDFLGNTPLYLSYVNRCTKITEILRHAKGERGMTKDNIQNFYVESYLADDFNNLFCGHKMRRRTTLGYSATNEKKEVMESRNEDCKETDSKKWMDVECEKKLCSLLDPPNDGWKEFGQYVFEKKDFEHLKFVSNDRPTKQLLNLFQKNGGNIDTLMDILLSSKSKCFKEAWKIVKRDC